MTAGTLAAPVFVPAGRDRATAVVAAIALAALAALPWALGGGQSALLRATGGAAGLWPLVAAAVAATLFAWRGLDRATAAAAGFAVLWAFAAGFAAGPRGLSFGVGAGVALLALTVVFARAIARRGRFAGDTVVATIVVVIAGLLVLFVFFPVGQAVVAALFGADGRFAPGLAAQRLLTNDIWSLGCFGNGTRCGV